MQVPSTMYNKAMKWSDHEEWLVAMCTELGLMDEIKVWELISNHWVFKFKTNNQKGGMCYKACLIAQGFSQVPGIYYRYLGPLTFFLTSTLFTIPLLVGHNNKQQRDLFGNLGSVYVTISTFCPRDLALFLECILSYCNM